MTKSNRKTKKKQLQFQLPQLLTQIRWNKTVSNDLKEGVRGHIYVLDSSLRSKVGELIRSHSPAWQIGVLSEQSEREVVHFAGVQGPVWIFCRRSLSSVPTPHSGRLDDSDYSWYRDQAGTILGYAKAYHVSQLLISVHQASSAAELGFFVGLGLSAYSYKGALAETGDLAPQIFAVRDGGTFDPDLRAQAGALVESVNLARHLVNAPPNFANPETLAALAQQFFGSKSPVKLQVWDAARLAKEGMGLHLGVGQGSAVPPCLLHLSYRPKGKGRSNDAPIAFVGKGVTFDSGGLDIKPSSGMRLMKKDMGGAASLFGLAQWVQLRKPSIPIDIYLGLAENSVDAHSMRPSDVLTARNGLRVEIHNTDAEGRLVLADALDVAVTAKGANRPRMVIDVATLTGAIKVGLGGEIAGLFANDDQLADQLNRAGAEMGEPNWRMPLYQRYNRGMDSAFADLVNAVDGFGGAITAALFLEKFVKGCPWAHMDIYGWNDKPMGPLTFSGGNGQPVQTLVRFLESLAGATS